MRKIEVLVRTCFVLNFTLLIPVIHLQGQTFGNYYQYEDQGSKLTFISDMGQKLRFTSYSNFVVRIQVTQKNEDFFADDHYEMVANHNRTGLFIVSDKGEYFEIATADGKDILIKLNKNPMRFEFIKRKDAKILLKSKDGITWNKTKIAINFEYDPLEHFCGIGHQAYGLVESIDLKGKTVSSNYGEGISHEWGKQAVLSVPFYLSNKGYGVFLNSTFPHKFIFGDNGKYEFGIDTKGFDGRFDFYFILGPEFKEILDRYTQLTGRPRLPQRSIFGLQLSDKGDPDNNGEEWWKSKITAHRNAGFPFDHIVNDNRWRAGSGAWSGSWFEWDTVRYPDPKKYAEWCKQNNVTVTLDLNRNISSASYGWKPEFNLPEAQQYVKEGYSTPDYSNPAVRKWVWGLFWKKSFDPSLKYPGDALWIDETDEMNTLPDSIICANGRSWAENRNYYHFLIAKAIVQEGWENDSNSSVPGIGEMKRPFVWMRGMTAGAQRYATYWTGDIKCEYEWMKKNIRAMQTAGLAGLPYFNHDAGGFRSTGPDDTMYIQWSMAFGSFTPIWRPHGIGTNKRWPLDRSEVCQKAAIIYGKLRYEMMPYIYTYAHEASANGLPMTRAMVIDYQNNENAWKYDLQYMWGNELLVAPVTTGHDTTITIWLPPEQNWYSLWNDAKFNGNQELQYKTAVGELPVFVKEGSIIPKYNYAQSTFLLNPEILKIDVYTGKNGAFALYEDDAVTEKYRTKNENRVTDIIYNDSNKKLTIKAAKGNYSNAPNKRYYKLIIHGFLQSQKVEINSKIVPFITESESLSNDMNGVIWSENTKTLHIYIGKQNVNSDVEIRFFD